MKIVVPESIEFFSTRQKEAIENLGVIFYDDYPTDDNVIIDRLKDAQVAAVKWIVLNENIVNNLPNLKYVITLSVGYNVLPLDVLKKRGIVVMNCPHHNALSVAEHTISLMLALIKHIPTSQYELQQGRWKASMNAYMGGELRGKRLLLIGSGSIGSYVFELARGIGMHAHAVNSKVSSEELNHQISKADIVSMHLPLNKSTEHLMNRDRLKLMKDTAYIINTSRGAVIDQSALIDALKNKQIAGAGLDVFEGEPLKLDVTDISAQIKELVNLPNVVSTPHIGYNTRESWHRLGDEFIENVEACNAGNPVNVVQR